MKCFLKIPLTLTQRQRVISRYRQLDYGIYSSEAGSDSRDKHTHAQLDSLIENVDMTISSRKGDLDMSAREKFEGFKKKIIDENEKKYGNEIRGKYGDQAVDDSNRNIENMTREEYDQVSELADQVTETLRLAFETGDPSSEPAQRCADLHRQWLSFYWKEYTKEAHAGIAQMYVDDERFTAYYDRDQPGMAKFLRDAIFIYTEKK